MSKTCPTCGANWDDARPLNLPMGQRHQLKQRHCFVCQGSGLVPQGFYGASTASSAQERCRSCGGSGLVWE